MAAPSIHEIILNVVGESDDAKRDLKELGAEMLALDAADAEAELRLDDSQFEREVKAAHAELTALGARSVTVKVDVDRDSLDAIGAAIGAATRAASSGGGGGTTGGGLLGMLSNMGGRVMLLLRLLPILIPMIVSLGAAAVGLAAHLAGAIAGLGALGVAAGAAATPIGVLAAAAISRFAGAEESAQALRAANEQVRNSVQAVDDAERSLAEAERQRRFAREALTQAAEDAAQQARDDLTTALEGQAAAENELEDAQQSQLAAQQALTDAREAAVRQLQDMRAAAEGARLGEKGAELALQRARNRLRELESEGASNMALREARLAVQQAELGLENARRDNQRSQEDLNDAERDGVRGSDQMVAARRALADADERVLESNRALAESNREVAAAQQAAAAPSQQVIDARRALADASRSVDDAEGNLARTTHDLAVAQRKQGEAAREAAQSSLGPAGHALKQAGRQTLDALREATDAGVNRIFRGLASAARSVRPLLRSLKGEFTGLGGAIGDAFADWGRELSRPEWIRFWERTTEAATRIVPDLNDGMRFLARVFRDIADAAMPFLEDGAESFRDWAKGLSQSTDDADGMSSAVGKLVDMAKQWFDLIGEGGKALFNIGRGAEPQISDWLDDITESLRDFNRWASTDEGKARIQEFFDNTVPAARDLLGAIGKLGEAFVRWGELASPALRPLYQIVGRVLDFLNGVLELLAKLPGPLGDLASGLAAFAGLRLVFGGGTGLLGSLGGVAKRLGGMPGLLRAVPYAAAAAAAVEYGDDLGKAAAELVGFSDAQIEAEENLRHAQTTLSTRLGDMAAVMRKFKRETGTAIRNRDELYALFSPKELDRAIEITKRGGDLMGHTFVQRALEKLRDGRRTFRQWFAGLGDDILGWVRDLSPQLERAGKTIIDGIAEGIKAFSPALGNALQAGIDAIGGLLDDGGGGRRRGRRGGKGGSSKIGDIAGAALDALGIDLADAAGRAAQNAKAAATEPLRARGLGKVGAGGVEQTAQNTFNMPLTVVGGGSPDPVATVQAVSRALRRRGLSLA